VSKRKKKAKKKAKKKTPTTPRPRQDPEDLERSQVAAAIRKSISERLRGISRSLRRA
jgi:hypothetical protein